MNLDPEHFDLLIDDTGWGCVLGGVVCGVYARGRFAWTATTIECFHPPAFGRKEYLTDYWCAFLMSLDELDIDVDRPRRAGVCSGWINNIIARGLMARGWTVARGTVVGLVQNLMVDAHRQYLVELTGEDVPRSYQGALDWAMMDTDRLKMCKLGWKAMAKLGVHVPMPQQCSRGLTEGIV